MATQMLISRRTGRAQTDRELSSWVCLECTRTRDSLAGTNSLSVKPELVVVWSNDSRTRDHVLHPGLTEISFTTFLPCGMQQVSDMHPRSCSVTAVSSRMLTAFHRVPDSADQSHKVAMQLCKTACSKKHQSTTFSSVRARGPQRGLFSLVQVLFLQAKQRQASDEYPQRSESRV